MVLYQQFNLYCVIQKDPISIRYFWHFLQVFRNSKVSDCRPQRAVDILCSGTQLGSLGLATVMINTAPVADPGFQVYKIYTELYLSIRFLNSVSVGPPMSVFMYVFLLKLSDLTGSVSR